MFLFVLAGFLLPILAQDLYAGEKTVTKLTTSNFKAVVERSEKPVLVKFYNPTCPHCTRMVGVWRQVGQHFDGHLGVAAVNCATDALCGKYRIQGVPDVKLFIKGPKGEPVPIDYRGDRTKDSIISFARPHLPSFVHKVSDSKKTGVESLEAFLEVESGLPHVLLFKSGTLVPTMPYKTLSVDFKGSFIFGIVNSAIDEGIAKKLDVELPKDKTPLVFIAPGGKKGEVYPGKNSFVEMKKYLKEQQKPTKEKSEL